MPSGARSSSCSHAGRAASHDRIDTELGRWCATREREPLVASLVAAGVPAAPVRDARASSEHPQMAARGLYEEIEHPVVGRQRLPTVPFRYASVARWLRRPAPTLGQHGREVLAEWIGLADRELDALEAANVIGTEPTGA
jgi:crotonobetainyl-CoA:carnitine CoA-transferase CaiB-like acyl-CoA transferase